MKKQKFFSFITGIVLLALMLLINHLLIESRVTRLIIEILAYIPVGFLVAKALTNLSFKKILLILLIASIILSIVVFTPDITSPRYLIIGVVCSFVSYFMTYFSIITIKKLFST